jgi:hypothetical protein
MESYAIMPVVTSLHIERTQWVYYIHDIL